MGPTNNEDSDYNRADLKRDIGTTIRDANDVFDRMMELEVEQPTLKDAWVELREELRHGDSAGR